MLHFVAGDKYTQLVLNKDWLNHIPITHTRGHGSTARTVHGGGTIHTVGITTLLLSLEQAPNSAPKQPAIYGVWPASSSPSLDGLRYDRVSVRWESNLKNFSTGPSFSGDYLVAGPPRTTNPGWPLESSPLVEAIAQAFQENRMRRSAAG